MAYANTPRRWRRRSTLTDRPPDFQPGPPTSARSKAAYPNFDLGSRFIVSCSTEWNKGVEQLQEQQLPPYLLTFRPCSGPKPVSAGRPKGLLAWIAGRAPPSYQLESSKEGNQWKNYQPTNRSQNLSALLLLESSDNFLTRSRSSKSCKF